MRFIIHTPDPTSLNITHLNESQPRLQGDRPKSTNNSSRAQVPNSEPETYQGDSFEALVSSEPRSALNNPEIASLFRHYIDYLAPWYDLCDAENLFGTIVPLHALENPILFKALIAFSALHKTGVSGEMRGLGQAFHAACIRDLLHVIDNFQLRLRGDYLAATCLLRSYEIIAGDSRKQQKHLLGAYLFSTRDPIEMNRTGLSQAGAWNYLREEITVALECQRTTRIGFDFNFDAAERYSDSMRANIISYILARVTNYCFQESMERQMQEKQIAWKSLRKELATWREYLPASFEPYSTAVKENNPFPSLWLIHPWHVAAQQYCSVAEILLALFDPFAPANQEAVLEHAIKICGLAYTNDNVAARVNAFGPLAFCGKYLVDSTHREGLKTMLRQFGTPTAWPVHCIIGDLEQYWTLMT
ncbi:uncharacterized protein BP5553_10439 [Venustampulla echinocandica]|uniref:Uncharacterized protein n=1 Tax=Venustampulla echinocandica TaxID=2656787 RepID=A0A370T9B0_9HELO|nr:uncharacterized protein BP5553_10439 [Venustampulla echinocandica]RDL30161.1 hypothetical protein BP5553_10439 [Venustampulla echinocandica]